MNLKKLYELKGKVLKIKKYKKANLTIEEKKELLKNSGRVPACIYGEDANREYIVKSRSIYRNRK